MESKEEQSKKKEFKLADLTADQHAVTTVTKFIKDLAFFYVGQSYLIAVLKSAYPE